MTATTNLQQKPSLKSKNSPSATSVPQLINSQQPLPDESLKSIQISKYSRGFGGTGGIYVDGVSQGKEEMEEEMVVGLT